MAIEEDEGLILDTESYSNGAFVASSIVHGHPDESWNNFEQACLHLSLSNNKDVKTMLVCFSHQSVASLTSVSAEYRHDVILHEGEAISASFPRLIRHDALNSND